MKSIRVFFLAAMMTLSTGALADTNKVLYHFSACTFRFQTQWEVTLSEEGLGNPDICKHLFMPPSSYNGHYIPIPTNATVFGVVVVTDGETSKVIPLFTWSDDKKREHFGCNGPTPWYARKESTQEGLLKSIVGAIKK
jgi:hypothetical protein